MTRHPSNKDHTASNLGPDGLRRRILRVGALSSAAIASLLAGRASSAAGGDDLAEQVRELRAREEIKELRAVLLVRHSCRRKKLCRAFHVRLCV